jgi:hypothetical protein
MSAETRVLDWNKLPSEYEVEVLLNGHDVYWKHGEKVVEFWPDQLVVLNLLTLILLT